tara:strand:+ start:27440 stop:28150 length:711 start_codon:yes stop_codon:yes gene_type:complete
MKSTYAFLSIAILVCSSLTSTSNADQPATVGDTTVLFDGSDMSHWSGRDDLWSHEDGQIVGRTSDADPIDANTFLIYQGDVPENFELTLQFKIESGNSGIQYRSKVLDEQKSIVGGYQADIDFSNKFAGILYEEKGRGILAKRGESVTIDADGDKIRKRFGDEQAMANAIHPGKWNDFRVVANGNHLQHFINEAMTVEVIDEQSEKAATDGVIALQIHKGPAMTVRFKNITLRELK